ncbi:MAG: hypothetical protein QOG10_7104, partial [Kribbellaceae bacterium]|nr:hypothetical protein [Kribbellaceae bacterium]
MPENNRTLAVGASGSDVANLQARLLDLDHAIALDELVESMFGASTSAAVMAVQSQAGIWASGVVDTGTVEALDRLPDSGWSFAVGRVTGPDGSAAHGVSVRLFDRDLRSEQELGRAETDDLGYWLVRYTRQAFARAEKDSADLFMRVVSGPRRLSDPPVRDTLFNARRLAVLSTSLTSIRPPRLTELERVEAAARPVLEDLAWAQVSEDVEHSDVTFLAGELGVDRAVVDHVAVAHRLAQSYDGHAAAFYAVLATDTLLGPRRWSTFTPRFVIDTSTSIPELFHDIVLLPTEVLRTAVETAVQTFLVPSATLDDLPAFEELLASRRGDADADLVTARQDAVLRHLAGALSSDAPAALLDLLQGEPRADLGDVLGQLVDIGALSRTGTDPAITKLRVAELLGDVPGTIAHLQ